MRSKLLLLTIIFSISIISCVNFKAFYNLKLYEVERPANAKERYGEQTITKLMEKGRTKYSYEDKLLKIIWFPTYSRFNFVLTNKTEHSFKIIWDEASYVNVNGLSNRVTHLGVNYIDINKSQPPTTIIRSSTISDAVMPTENVYYVLYEGWKESPLFPNQGFSNDGGSSKNSIYKGRKVQIMLPIQIENVVNEYIFSFEIEDIKYQAVN